MPHQHNVHDTDLHFLINPITRAITNQSGKAHLMQYDHNSERATFKIPRLVDGHDMSQCSKIEVHFINVAADNTGQHADVYPVDDMRVDPDSDDSVIFGWLISQNATQYAGTLNFLVRFVCMTGKTLDYIWNSGIFKGISISAGMNNGEAVVEEYADILATWAASIAALESIGKEHAEQLATHQELLDNLKNNQSANNELAGYIEKVAEVEDRVSLLEGALIEYVEDSTAAFEKRVPNGVAQKAILESAEGCVRSTGKNLFDPSIIYGAIVNADGSFTVEYDFGEENYYNEWYCSITLPQGHYYINSTVNKFGTVYDLGFYYNGTQDGETDASDSEIYVYSDTATVGFKIYLDGVGMCGGTFKVMISKEDGAAFEPYGEVTSALTSVEVISPNLLDYTKLGGGLEIIDGGVRICDYYVYGAIGFSELMRHLGVSAGDVITVSAKVEVHDISGNYSGTPCASLMYDGPSSFRIDLCEDGHTVTIPEDLEYVDAYISSNLDLEFSGNSNGSYVDVTKIMIVKGTEKQSYVPFSNGPMSEFVIPSHIQQIAEQCKKSCIINFSDKVVIADGKTTDVAPYLTDYANHKMLEVRPGAIVRFANQAEAPVQSTIIYAKPKGGVTNDI